jgi:hypothetical protein
MTCVGIALRYSVSRPFCCNLDPFDCPDHPIKKHREPSIRRTDVAEQHGFT